MNRLLSGCGYNADRVSSRSAPPVSELSLVSLASYLDTQQSAGYREGLADVADPRPRRGLGMRGRTYRTAVHSTHARLVPRMPTEWCPGMAVGFSKEA